MDYQVIIIRADGTETTVPPGWPDLDTAFRRLLDIFDTAQAQAQRGGGHEPIAAVRIVDHQGALQIEMRISPDPSP